MCTTLAGPEGAVEVRRTFAATPEKVFQAWTDPSKMTKWFARGTEQNTVTRMDADVRPGGKYAVHILSSDGKKYHMSGTYREVRPPEKLVFTWIWEDAPDFWESLVTIEFRRLGQSAFTEIVLKHELLAEKYRADHQKGWISCFDLLDKALA
jgi:uncharacterized protein YndB with AHSA1/START domain